MPRKRPGLHLFHVELPEENWQLLQRYCFGGIERISATAIVNTLVNAYVEEHLKPRLAADQVAETQPIRLDISKTIKKVAHRIEPDEFPEA
jgi:hypothetical protein